MLVCSSGIILSLASGKIAFDWDGSELGTRRAHHSVLKSALAFVQQEFTYTRMHARTHTMQVKKNDLTEVHELVAALNPCARIVEATHSTVPVKDITRTSMFDLEQVTVLTRRHQMPCWHHDGCV